jgi:hypothetical protein
MSRSTHFTLAALFAAAAMAAAPFGACGQSILDQQLGGEPAPPAPAVTPAPSRQTGTSTPAPGNASARANPAANPVVPRMGNADAARQLDDMDLVRRLTQPDNGSNQTGAPEQLKDMIDRMGQSETRLADKDYGAVTQETQRRILVDLDALIEIARKQGNSSSKGQGQSRSGQRLTATKSPTSHEGGSTAATDENVRMGDSDTPESNGANIHQTAAREWGNLPDRDRDLVSHGATEQYLPAYRTLIDRYYQALSQLGKQDQP